MSDVGGAGVGRQTVAHGQVADVVQGGADLFVLVDQRLDAARDRLGVRRRRGRAGPAGCFGSLDGREDDLLLLLEVDDQLGRRPSNASAIRASSGCWSPWTPAILRA